MGKHWKFYLLIKIDKLFGWKLQWLYYFENSVPMTILNVMNERVDTVNCVQRDIRFLLQKSVQKKRLEEKYATNMFVMNYFAFCGQP